MPRNLGIKPGGIDDETEFPRTAGSLKVQRVRETWQVIGDFPGQEAAAIKNTPGIPREGDTRGIMGVKSVAAKEVDAQAAQWDVDVQWDSRVEGENRETDPTLWRPEVEWDYEEVPHQVDIDQITGELIATAAGEKFPEGITTMVPVSVRTLSRIEPYDVVDYYDDIQRLWGARVNSKDFRGWPIYTVKMAGIRVREQIIDRVRYARVSYITKHLPLVAVRKVVLRSDPEPTDNTLPAAKLTFEIIGWRASLLHQGTKFVEDATVTPNVVKTYISPETRRSQLVNLRANGELLGPTEQAVYLKFHPLQAKDFNELKL